MINNTFEEGWERNKRDGRNKEWLCKENNWEFKKKLMRRLRKERKEKRGKEKKWEGKEK